MNPDTIGCVWTGKFDLNTLRVDGDFFLNPERKICGFKNIRIRVDGAYTALAELGACSQANVPFIVWSDLKFISKSL